MKLQPCLPVQNLTVSGPTPAHPLPPLSSCLPPLPHTHPPFPLLPLHCKKLEDSVYNPSYSLPIGGFSNNYLSHLFGNLGILPLGGLFTLSFVYGDFRVSSL